MRWKSGADSHATDILLSPEGPITSPQAALIAARSAVKPARILIAEGTYILDQPLQMDAQDSQVTWSSPPKAAFFIGNVKLE